jgi:hypothetical protein
LLFDKSNITKIDAQHHLTPAKRLPWWYEHYKRIRLFPWWTRYNIGLTEEASHKDKILELAAKNGF